MSDPGALISEKSNMDCQWLSMEMLLEVCLRVMMCLRMNVNDSNKRLL